MKSNKSKAHWNWEHQVLHELRKEYQSLLLNRGLNLNPAALSLTDSLSCWAFFNPEKYTLFFSRNLVKTQPWNFVRGVLKHEVAHQWLFQKDPQSFSERPHGAEFQIACQRVGVPNPFNQARVHESSFQEETLRVDPTSSETNRHLERVKKLLSLAQSTHEHEAQRAMVKAQELIAIYNLNSFETWSKHKFCHHWIRTEKQRLSSWESKILSILIESFFVEVILIQEFNTSTLKNVQTIELLGTQENVEMASYVYHFLNIQLNQLVQSHELAGRSQKSSYRLGVLEGFSQKLKKLSSSVNSSATTSQTTEEATVQKALLQFESQPQLKSYIKEIYPRLHSRKSSFRSIDQSVYCTGYQDGQKIVLSRPLEGPTSARQIASLTTHRKDQYP